MWVAECRYGRLFIFHDGFVFFVVRKQQEPNKVGGMEPCFATGPYVLMHLVTCHRDWLGRVSAQ